MAFIIRYQDKVSDDLKTIKAYLQRFSEDAPYKVLAKMVQRIDLLAQFPGMGRRCAYDPDYQQLTVDDYWVLYQADEKRQAIEIHYILHSSRNIEKILATKDRSFAPPDDDIE